MGQTVAIDGSDMPAYANGHKHVGNLNGPLRTRFADPDAGWGHRSSISTRKGGAFYGFKLHMAICTQTELPLAWTVRTAAESEQEMVPPCWTRSPLAGSRPESPCWTSYDARLIYEACEGRDMRPVIPLKMTAAVPAGTSPRPAITAPGRSPDRTPSAARRNGGAPRASVRPRQCGSRPAGCTR